MKRQSGHGALLLACSWRPKDTSHQRAPVNEEITDRARSDRLRLIRDELLRRIRPVCAEMPQDLFLELVDAMAAVQLKYELRERRGPGQGS